jgi:sugar phosphate isomerase/epimerase
MRETISEDRLDSHRSRAVHHDRVLSRRSFIGRAVASAAVSPLAATALAVNQQGGNFTVAMQGYSLKRLNFLALLETARDLGVSALELYDRQFSVFMSETDRVRAQESLAAFGIAPIATYTDLFSEDEERNRAILTLAEQMQLRHVCCRPNGNVVKMLDRLLEKRAVGVGVHNTSPGPGRWPVTIDDVETMLDRHSRLQACADIGNFARARIDPVSALRACRDRMIAVHIKDIDRAGRSTTLGEGLLDIPGVIHELRKGRFSGLLILEHPTDSLNIDAHVHALRTSLKRLREWIRG